MAPSLTNNSNIALTSWAQSRDCLKTTIRCLSHARIRLILSSLTGQDFESSMAGSWRWRLPLPCTIITITLPQHCMPPYIYSFRLLVRCKIVPCLIHLRDSGDFTHSLSHALPIWSRVIAPPRCRPIPTRASGESQHSRDSVGTGGKPTESGRKKVGT